MTAREESDYLHLWRYCAYLLGTEDALLPKSVESAWKAARCIELTQGPPDDDSRELVRTLLETPLVMATTPREKRVAMSRVAVSRAACRYLIGEDLADQLRIPRSQFSPVMTYVRRVVTVSEHLREAFELFDFAAEYVGRYHWYRASGPTHNANHRPDLGV